MPPAREMNRDFTASHWYRGRRPVVVTDRQRGRERERGKAS